MAKKYPRTHKQFMALPIVDRSEVEKAAFYVPNDMVVRANDADGAWWQIQVHMGDWCRVKEPG